MESKSKTTSYKEIGLGEEYLITIHNTCKENGLSDEEIQEFLSNPYIQEEIADDLKKRRQMIERASQTFGIPEIETEYRQSHVRLCRNRINELLLHYKRQKTLKKTMENHVVL